MFNIGDKVCYGENFKEVGIIKDIVRILAGDLYIIRNDVSNSISNRSSKEIKPYTEKTTDCTIKPDLHEKICRELNLLYKAKNADYGDSFVKVRQIVPNAILVRLNDKIQRLNKLMTTDEHNVKSESIRDTLLDLANYAIMELVEMEDEI